MAREHWIILWVVVVVGTFYALAGWWSIENAETLSSLPIIYVPMQ